MKTKMKCFRGVLLLIGVGCVLTYSNVIAAQWIKNAKVGRDTIGSSEVSYYDPMHEMNVTYTSYTMGDCCVQATDMNACDRGAYNSNCPYQKPAGDAPIGQ